MGEELICVGVVDRAAGDCSHTGDGRRKEGAVPTPIAEVGWGCWCAGCVPAGRFAVRLPRWIGRPERIAEARDFRAGAAQRRAVSRHGVPDTPLGAALRAVRATLEPGVTSGQVSFVLASFPSSFEYSVAHRLWLDRVLGELEGFPLVAGFWSSGWYTSRLIDGLKQRDVALCLYDAPHAEGVPPAVEVLTADRVYLRLLGRNDEAWQARHFGHVLDYRYTEREIAELLPRAAVWAREANAVGLVFANGRWAGESAALLAERIALMAGCGGATRTGGALNHGETFASAGEAPP